MLNIFKRKNILKIIVAAIVLILVYRNNNTNATQSESVSLTGQGILERIESASELTTSKLIYNGMVKFEEGKIPLITKNSFIMLYMAEVRAGVDVKEIDLKEDSDSVTLKLPMPQVLGVSINSESIQFVDNKYSLFNWSKKEDIVTALKYAEEDVLKQGSVSELLAQSKDNTSKLLNGLLDGLLGDRRLIIEYSN